MVIVALASALAGSFVYQEPETLCSARLNATVLRFPCVWGGQTYQPMGDRREARLELRPFSIDGQTYIDRRSDYIITVWFVAQMELQRGNIFATFGFTKQDFDRLSSTPTSADFPSKFDSPKPRLYHLTFKPDGDEWIVQTFYRDSFEPLPDGTSMNAVTESWHVRFEPGDTDVPSFSMLCHSFAANCSIQLKGDGFSTITWVSRKLVGDHKQVVAIVKAITAAILEGKLSPSEDANPCVVLQVCLPGK